MHDHSSPASLYTLQRAKPQADDWPRLYRLALAAGHGETVAPEEERVAAADELLAHTLIELVTLGELAALAGVPLLAEQCRVPLARTSASVLRLLDRALAAHGRDVGYSTRVWRQDIIIGAVIASGMLEQPDADPHPLPATIDRAARAIADTIPALTRDRIEVPAALTRAASELLLVYAAASDPAPN